MNPLEFGYYLRGLCAAEGVGTADVAKAALASAREILKLSPAPLAPPALIPLTLPMFCVHNVHLDESCAACGYQGTRIFGIKLAAGVKQVYLASVPPGETRAP